MAGTTRLELATSAVTGQRSNQLNYVPTAKSTTYAKTLQMKALHGLHTAHRVLTLPGTALPPGKTANKPPIRIRVRMRDLY